MFLSEVMGFLERVSPPPTVKLMVYLQSLELGELTVICPEEISSMLMALLLVTDECPLSRGRGMPENDCRPIAYCTSSCLRDDIFTNFTKIVAFCENVIVNSCPSIALLHLKQSAS